MKTLFTVEYNVHSTQSSLGGLCLSPDLWLEEAIQVLYHQKNLPFFRFR